MCGMCVVVLPWGIYWLSVGAIKRFFRQWVLFRSTTYSKTSALPFPPIRSSFTVGPDLSIFLFYLAPVVVIGGAGALGWTARKHFGMRESKFTFLLAWPPLFYCQVLVRTDLDQIGQ